MKVRDLLMYAIQCFVDMLENFTGLIVDVYTGSKH